MAVVEFLDAQRPVGWNLGAIAASGHPRALDLVRRILADTDPATALDTDARTLPLALFGSAGYGARQGWLMVPARIAQALAPWSFGLVLDRLQAHALWVTAGIGLSAFLALWALRSDPRPDR